MGASRFIATALVMATTTATSLHAQEAPELRGTVVSSEGGASVAGAWIALEGYEWGTFSWNDGHFFLPEIPGRPARYEVSALGYEPEVMTLDPAAGELMIELTPDAEVLEGVRLFMEQVERRRHRGGGLRAFDREALAFHGYFDLRDFLAQHRVQGVRRVCLDERPEAIGILDREGHEYYMAEVAGGYLRLYTEEFVARAARERLELYPEPAACRGPLSSDTD